MKFRYFKPGIVFMAGIVTAVSAFWGNAQTVQASLMQAGVSAVLTDALDKSGSISVKREDSGSVGTAQASDGTAVSKDQTDDKKKEKDTDRKKKKDKEPDTICGYQNLGIANVDNYLNIREEASEDAKLVGKLPSKAGCEILDSKDGWYYVKSGRVQGYVRGDYVATGPDAEALAHKYKKDVATVNTETLFVREEPNTDCTILALVSVGDELEVTKKGDEWTKVKVDDDEGYVSNEYVDITEELKKAITITEFTYGEGVSDVRVSLVQAALSYVGNSYVWGGTSLTNGVDCSGFTMQIYARYGIYLPHSSRAQAGYGRSVSPSELQPGDLIFYGSRNSISHVAIYIGNGQIVHASNSRDGIKVSYAFYRTPICCRRLL